MRAAAYPGAPNASRSTIASVYGSSPDEHPALQTRSPPGAAQRIGPVVFSMPSGDHTAKVSVHGRASPAIRQLSSSP